jgi:hypothetical protein
VARAATIFGLFFVIFVIVGSPLGPTIAAERDRLDEPFEITADRIRYDGENDLYVAEGRVRVVQGERDLKARWLAFSTTTRIGVAEGDVELYDGSDQLQADFMLFDVDTLQGMLYQGSLDSGGSGFQVRAKELIRTGQNTFTVRDGRFTTCRCEPGERLPWEIHAKNAKIEVGGYGTIENSTIDVLGVPVLWIPWAFFPVKSERETGFLLPDFEFGGRGGANFGLPFFWAALPQLNVTLTPRYFVDRGYKQDVELEYVFGEQSEGQLFVAGLHDRSTDSGSSYPADRWAVIWEHDQTLPEEWRWQTDLRLFSDNLYPADFKELRSYKSFRFVESTTNAARDFGESGGVGLMAGARFADDVQGSTYEDSDEYIRQRWTELRGDVQPGTFEMPFGIEARFDSELIYFAGIRTTKSELDGRTPAIPPPLRTDGRFYDIGVDGRFDTPPSPGQGDGIFQPGEPLAERGARLIVHPRLARSFQLGNLVEFAPEVGWQQTLYKTDAQQFAERGLFTARAEFRGRLVRDYVSESGRAVRHLVEPSLGWALVSQAHQRSNPLFVPRPQVEQVRLRTLSLENVTRNPSDRIEAANQVVLGVGQRFFVRKGPTGVARLLADVKTAIDWDFADGGGLGNIVLESRLFPVGPVSSYLKGSFNPESVAVEEGEAGLNLSLPVRGRVVNAASVGVQYHYLRKLPLFFESAIGTPSNEGESDDKLNQIDLRGRIELGSRIRLGYSAIYSFTGKEGFIRNRGRIDYVSKCRCWGIGAIVGHEREDGFSGGFEIRFLGLGDERSNLFNGGLGTGLNF